uniref:Uncharacterized protein n=1 Tax=Pinctada fucata TaxID=50426 RepID=A0A194AN99_PINFU
MHILQGTKMKTHIFFILVCLSNYFKDSIACSCFPESITKKLENAKFAIKATVYTEERKYSHGYNETTDPWGNFLEYEYSVYARDIYKGGDLFGGRYIKITTPGNDGLCGTRIPIPKNIIGRLYNNWIMTGYIYDGSASVSSCDWIVKANGLSPYQKSLLNFFKHTSE